MDKIVWALIIVSVLFILTYNPQSGRIEQFNEMVKYPGGGGGGAAPCDENTRYQRVQFGNQTCPPSKKIPTTVDGVVIATNT